MTLVVQLLMQVISGILPLLIEYGKEFGTQILNIVELFVKKAVALGLDVIVGAETPAEALGDVKSGKELLLVYVDELLIEGGEAAQGLPLKLVSAISTIFKGSIGTVLSFVGL